MSRARSRACGAALSACMGAATLAGCGDDVGGPGWTASTDTVAGVVRVTNTPPAEGARATLVAVEELRVGDVEGAEGTPFGMIRSVAVLDDGRFAVGDAQAEEVRLFDRDGRHLRTFGGQGAGPGELRGMQGVFADHEGRLRVAEQGNARLSVFDPDSGFVTSFPLRLFSYGFRGPWKAAMDATGRTVVASSGRYGEGRSWSMLRVYDPAMVQLDSIPYHDYTDEYSNEDPPGAWRVQLGANAFTWAPVPYFAQPHETLAANGDFWSSRAGVSHLEVARWTPAGDTSVVVIGHRPPESVSPAERDSAMAALIGNFAKRMPDPPKLDASRVPSTKPPVHGVSLDDRDRLWVRITGGEADTTAYDVFGPDGRHAETVALPFRVDPWIPPVLRGDTLWVVATDDMDVQTVVRARLRPAADTPGG